MRTWMLALAAGLVLPRFVPALPSVWILCVLGVLGGLLLSRRRWASSGLLLLGFAWACWQCQSAIDDRLPVSQDGRTYWIQGTVSGSSRGMLGCRRRCVCPGTAARKCGPASAGGLRLD